jgi:hypothetical protein
MGFPHNHRTTEETGPVAHDSQSEALVVAQVERDAHAVIPHAQNNSVFAGRQADRDPCGFSVSDRIPDSLLRDPVDVNLRWAVMPEC